MKNKLAYSILFLKGQSGININELSSLLKISPSETKKVLNELSSELKQLKWPIEIKENEHKIRLTLTNETSLELSKTMDKNINVNLTKSLLETLTIIAYNQPATKPDVENIRGVSSEHSFLKLLEYGLIEAIGRSDNAGKPWLYKTTPYFLELFGLNSIDDLPKTKSDFKEITEEISLFDYSDNFNDNKEEN